MENVRSSLIFHYPFSFIKVFDETFVLKFLLPDTIYLTNKI